MNINNRLNTTKFKDNINYRLIPYNQIWQKVNPYCQFGDSVDFIDSLDLFKFLHFHNNITQNTLYSSRQDF